VNDHTPDNNDNVVLDNIDDISDNTNSSNDNFEQEHVQSDNRNNRSIRTRNPPSYLKDYHMFSIV